MAARLHALELGSAQTDFTRIVVSTLTRQGRSRTTSAHVTGAIRMPFEMSLFIFQRLRCSLALARLALLVCTLALIIQRQPTSGHYDRVLLSTCNSSFECLGVTDDLYAD
jgi:hypothetical protein